ncbi:MAG TPA: hypothetical protein DCG19_02295 [Cryomorphaceae bacterium]|nr:hypothetical protein [Owenweeksia sp.]MBF99654.1 hypothetical protein [Owenweeksia sp.]HAD96203.1 hypothetical protein [Cryomorphaceae bacterium]HBF18713.1 hypothetical protein [Cryomorphaceae bacterium]
MKKIMLLTLFCTALSFVAKAQPAGLNVYNKTRCYIEVTAWAYNSVCDDKCPSTTVCLPPGGGYTLLAPCGRPNWQWEFVAVKPVKEDCTDCGLPQTPVGAPGAICKSYPTRVSSIDHCNCAPFTAGFVNSNTLVMH